MSKTFPEAWSVFVTKDLKYEKVSVEKGITYRTCCPCSDGDNGTCCGPSPCPANWWPDPVPDDLCKATGVASVNEYSEQTQTEQDSDDAAKNNPGRPECAQPNPPSYCTFCQGEGCLVKPNYKYYTTTNITTKTQVCGKIDGKKTCTIGTYGTADCAGGDSCKYWDQWDIIPSGDHDYHNGWVQCHYFFDYTNYNYSNGGGIGPVKLSRWINDICQGKSDSAPDGMDSTLKNWLRDGNFIYSGIFDFYNQLYNLNFYSRYNSLFNELNFFQYANVTNFIQSYYQGQLAPLILSSYSGSVTMPSGIVAVLNTSLQMPKPSQDLNKPDDYYITLWVGYDTYEKFIEGKQSTDIDKIVNSFMNSLLRDSEGLFTDLSTQRQWKPNGPGFINSVVSKPSYVDLLNNYTFYEKLATDPKPGMLFCTVEITSKVDSWSPLLAAYFQAFNTTITFDPTTCAKMASAAGANSSDNSTITTGCYNQNCSNIQECKKFMGSFCALSYFPPSYTNRGDIDQLLFSQNSDDCMCYTSTLAPVSQKSVGNSAAMCFDNHCNNEDLSAFGLTDSACHTYCDEVWGWLNNTNPANQPQNAASLDKDKFWRICGKNYNPYTNAKYNKSVLVTMIFFSVLICGLIFSLGKKREWSTFKINTTMLIVLILLGGITYVLTKFLAGQAMCDGSKFLCQSGLGIKEIPPEFCDFVLNCECAFDKDCPSGCVCQSSTCTPIQGTRPTKNVDYRKKNWYMIVSVVILSLILGLTLSYLYEDYHWPIPEGIFKVIVLCLCLVPVIYILYDNLKKKTKKIFTAKCGEQFCVGKKPCDDNGHGGVCPCPDPSEVCVNGECVKTTSDLCNLTGNPSMDIPIAVYSNICPLPKLWSYNAKTQPYVCNSCTITNPTFSGSTAFPTEGTVTCQECTNNITGKTSKTPGSIPISPYTKGFILDSSGNLQISITNQGPPYGNGSQASVCSFQADCDGKVNNTVVCDSCPNLSSAVNFEKSVKWCLANDIIPTC